MTRVLVIIVLSLSFIGVTSISHAGSILYLKATTKKIEVIGSVLPPKPLQVDDKTSMPGSPIAQSPTNDGFEPIVETMKIPTVKVKTTMEKTGN